MDMECSDHDPVRALAVRVRKLEMAIEGLGLEVRTLRLVVINSRGVERIVGEVVPGGTAELRMDLPDSPPGERTAVMVFANPGDAANELPAGVGVHLWVDGDAAKALDVWVDEE